MATYPEDLKYTLDHEWVRIEGDQARVGVSDFAQSSLGDIVFVALPELGSRVEAGSECGEIESTKSVSPIVAPVTGTVTAVNAELDAAPEAINSDPYGSGWMFEVALDQGASADQLLSVEEYREQLG